MAKEASLRRATPRDAAYLAPRLRHADIQEIKASSGLDPYEDLMAGLELSHPCAWVMADAATDRPFLMGGVRPLSTKGVGLVWFLAAPDIVRYARAIRRTARDMLRSLFMAEGYNTVGNLVDVRNHTAIRWLYKTGFSFLELNVPAGVNGEPFHLFAMCRERFLERYPENEEGTEDV